MKYSTKLAVHFSRDHELDANKIHSQVQQFYPVGYIGLYKCDGCHVVYIQGAHKNVRMAPRKIHSMCQQFGHVSDVRQFNKLKGDMVEEVGTFRTRGRQSKDESTSTGVLPTTLQTSTTASSTYTSTPLEKRICLIYLWSG